MFCKRLLIINLLCVFLGVLQVNALDLPERIVQSLEAGNAKNMSKFFNSSVELIFTQSQGVYAKSQAEQILKNFFDNTGPYFKYKHIHHTSSKDNTQYNYIGQLYTSRGTYRVNIYMKNQCIHQMRIESND